MFYYIASTILVLGILYGITLMSKVHTARLGNGLSTVCTALAIVLTLHKYQLFSDFVLFVFVGIGLVLGLLMTKAVKMIQMPQAVALLNGFGGLASALVAIISISGNAENDFALYTAGIAIVVGIITFSGSMIAGAKLHKILAQKPTILKMHNLITSLLIILTILSVVFIKSSIWGAVIFSTLFGIIFSIRVGGADMPITISLLNSLSGVAGGIAGIAIYDPLLTAVGGIVGASGLILTQIMCKAMNRKLLDILLGKTSVSGKKEKLSESAKTEDAKEEISVEEVLRKAKKVIIVPGYGMALSQAQLHVKMLNEKLEGGGAQVKFAIHPVAGRMPGHMNVLLCEVDVPYESLYEMDDINDEFKDTDLAIVIGANDVVNPAANTAEGTPIYGMPILKVEDAKHIIVCNFDLKPGYAGVDNPLYNNPKTIMIKGDAKESVQKLIDILSLKTV